MPLFIGVGLFVLLVHPGGTLLTLALIALGAIAGMSCALIRSEKAPRSERVAQGLAGLVVGAAAIYLVMQVDGAMGWVVFGLALVLIVPLICMVGCLLNAAWPVLSGKREEKLHSVERAAVRVGIPALLALACYAAIRVSYDLSKSEIPGFAFGSHVVLAVQLALLFFYGLLLVVVPVARAISDGELPIELTTKGARYPEKELASSRAATEDVEEELDLVRSALVEQVEETSAKASQGIQALNERMHQLDAAVEELSEKC